MARSLGVGFAFLVVAGCKTPSQAIQQKVPTAAAVDPSMKPASLEACKSVERHDLLVIDWTPEARGDLEVAMKEGLAVVSYDCKSVKLVHCTPEGSYGFIGTTRRDKKLEMNTADEIGANLPTGGLTWLTELGAKVGRESALAAQLVMVGKRSFAAKRVGPEALAGCSGATHYVRAAWLGAFAVAAGSKAEIGATATLFAKGAKAESKSSTKITAQDGEVEACAKSTPDAKAPPDQCGAIIRVELEPVGAPALEGAAADLVVAKCAQGFAMSDGKCVRLDKPHQCKPGDAKDCTSQCDAGDAASCATLAVMHREGAGVAKDLAKAAELGKRACDKDVMVGCRVVAGATLDGGKKKERAAALELLVRACNAGDGAGCVELGVARLGDPKTAGDSQYAFRRACYGGGEIEGCVWLGTLYSEGKGGLTANPKLAVPFFEKGCKGGSAKACDALGDLLAKGGKGVPKDAVRAKALFAKACEGGHEPACKKS